MITARFHGNGGGNMLIRLMLIRLSGCPPMCVCRVGGWQVCVCAVGG